MKRLKNLMNTFKRELNNNRIIMKKMDKIYNRPNNWLKAQSMIYHYKFKINSN